MPENKKFTLKYAVFLKKLFTFLLKYVIINGGLFCTFDQLQKIQDIICFKIIFINF